MDGMAHGPYLRGSIGCGGWPRCSSSHRPSARPDVARPTPPPALAGAGIYPNDLYEEVWLDLGQDRQPTEIDSAPAARYSPPTVRRRGVLGLLLVALAASAAPGDWEATRRTVIDPLNTELHRHLPAFLKSRDLDAVLGLYATPTGGGLIFDRGHAVHAEREEGTRRWDGNRGPEPIRTRYERLLALFATVEKRS